MTRRKNPEAPPALPLADRVLAFFEANLDESLTRRDVAEKFGVHFKHVAVSLTPLVREGALAQGGSGSKYDPFTYSAGIGLLDGSTGVKIDKPAKPTTTTPPDVHPGAPVGWRLPTVAEPLSDRERQVLDYCRIFLRENDQMPPCTSIKGAFGFKSANAASEIMLTLERKGHLVRNELGWLMFARYAVGTWSLA